MSDDPNVSRRRFLAGAGAAALAGVAGCSYIMPRRAEFTTGTEAFTVKKSNPADKPDLDVGVKIEIAESVASDLDYLVSIHDGEQLAFRPVGLGERTVWLPTAFGTNTILGVQGGHAVDGSLVDGEVVVEATLETAKARGGVL